MLPPSTATLLGKNQETQKESKNENKEDDLMEICYDYNTTEQEDPNSYFSSKNCYQLTNIPTIAQSRATEIEMYANYLRERQRGTPEYVERFITVATQNLDFDFFSVLRGDELEEIERCENKKS